MMNYPDISGEVARYRRRMANRYQCETIVNQINEIDDCDDSNGCDDSDDYAGYVLPLPEPLPFPFNEKVDRHGEICPLSRLDRFSYAAAWVILPPTLTYLTFALAYPVVFFCAMILSFIVAFYGFLITTAEGECNET